MSINYVKKQVWLQHALTKISKYVEINGIRKIPARKIPTHQTLARKIPTRKIPTQKIPTWNIPTHVFKYSNPSFSIFCFFIIVTVIIDIN